ncbi:MAG: response regulator [Deltaproteobacteria bacterium]|jgi:CheY-like chemotaxis protein
MKPQTVYPVMLMADDDPDDFFLTRAALEESGAQIQLHRVANGEELLDYLFDDKSALPSLILLDLNMPLKDGKEVLSILKSEPNLRQIPVVVYTSSTSADDIMSSYRLGASTYISKPNSFQSLVETMKTLCSYWLDVAALPFSEAELPPTTVQATG